MYVGQPAQDRLLAGLGLEARHGSLDRLVHERRVGPLGSPDRVLEKTRLGSSVIRGNEGSSPSSTYPHSSR